MEGHTVLKSNFLTNFSD